MNMHVYMCDLCVVRRVASDGHQQGLGVTAAREVERQRHGEAVDGIHVRVVVRERLQDAHCRAVHLHLHGRDLLACTGRVADDAFQGEAAGPHGRDVRAHERVRVEHDAVVVFWLQCGEHCGRVGGLGDVEVEVLVDVDVVVVEVPNSFRTV